MEYTSLLISLRLRRSSNYAGGRQTWTVESMALSIDVIGNTRRNGLLGLETPYICCLYFIPQNAEPAVNTDIALPTRASAGFSFLQNVSTNSMESAALNWPLPVVSRSTDSESTRGNQNQPTEANYSAGNLDEQLLLTSLPPCLRNHTVESVEFTNNSSLASEQRVSRATALLHRVMEERAEEQEQFRQREMNRREQEIREQRGRERIEREVRGMEEASRWPEQQEAITVPCCTCPFEKAINFYFQFLRDNF